MRLFGIVGVVSLRLVLGVWLSLSVCRGIRVLWFVFRCALGCSVWCTRLLLSCSVLVLCLVRPCLYLPFRFFELSSFSGSLVALLSDARGLSFLLVAKLPIEAVHLDFGFECLSISGFGSVECLSVFGYGSVGYVYGFLTCVQSVSFSYEGSFFLYLLVSVSHAFSEVLCLGVMTALFEFDDVLDCTCHAVSFLCVATLRRLLTASRSTPVMMRSLMASDSLYLPARSCAWTALNACLMFSADGLMW